MVLEKKAGTTDNILKCLNSDGVIIMPCDTIYGIVCNAGPAEEKIRTIKGRGETKPFINLVPSADFARNISADTIDEKILSLWPGPLTVIVRKISGGTIALRVPQDDFLRSLMTKTGKPMISTSVNRSGFPSLNDIDQIVSEFGSEVDMIIDGGNLDNPVPSTIIDLTVKPARILRQGQCVIPGEILG